MVAAESDDMTLPAVVKMRQSPWHEDNLVLFAGLSLRRVNIPTPGTRPINSWQQ
jgi:hypothetical protein